MAQTYIYTTTDGEEIHVDSSQAGDIITTPQGKSIEIPTLSELRKLPLVEEVTTSPKSKWTLAHSLCMLKGIVLTIMSGISIFVLLVIYALPTESIDLEMGDWAVETVRADVEKKEVAELVEIWGFFNNEDSLGVARAEGDGYRKDLAKIWWMQTLLVASIIGTIVGVLMIAAPVVITAKRSA